MNERSSPADRPSFAVYWLKLAGYALLVLFLPLGAAWECYRVVRNLTLWQPLYTRELILGLLLLPLLWAVVASIGGNLLLVPALSLSSKIQDTHPERTSAYQKILRLGISILQRLGLLAIWWRTLLGRARWLLAIALLVLPVWLLLHSGWGTLFTGSYYRYLLLIGSSLLVAVLLRRDSDQLVAAPQWFAALLLVSAAIAFGQAVRDATSYPFSLTWSEGNRMWDYSVLFGRRLYNYPADQPIHAYIDWGRQVMWGLPFLFADISIVQMRIWSGLLFSVPYMIFGWIIFRPLSSPGRTAGGVWFLCGLWTFLFLNQGPIYAPLVISAILVALAWRRPLWIGLPLIFLAGYFAQASRFTWMFAPAMWAGMLYFADQFPGQPESQHIRASNWKLAIAGGIAGLCGGYLYPRLRDAVLAVITSSQPGAATGTASAQPDLISVEGISAVVSRQDLLWSRLLPNPTYKPGILLALALATIPLIIFLVYLVRSRRWSSGWLRGGAMVAVLALFLGVGLVVSVKIGGGSNLHNLDMFLIGLVFAAALAWVSGGHAVVSNLEKEPGWVASLFIVMVLIFAYTPLLSSQPLVLPPEDVVRQSLRGIQRRVERASQSGEVLFIDQRQLLTFGNVQDVPLVPEYEKKYMMDQAMTGDKKYFDQFYGDLAQARFALIVTEPLWDDPEEKGSGFGEENDAWVKWVSRPVLCYYKPVAFFREVHVQLLAPREQPKNCP